MSLSKGMAGHADEVAVLGFGHARGKAADGDGAVQAGPQALPEVRALGPLKDQAVEQGALGRALACSVSGTAIVNSR